MLAQGLAEAEAVGLLDGLLDADAELGVGALRARASMAAGASRESRAMASMRKSKAWGRRVRAMALRRTPTNQSSAPARKRARSGARASGVREPARAKAASAAVSSPVSSAAATRGMAWEPSRSRSAAKTAPRTSGSPSCWISGAEKGAEAEDERGADAANLADGAGGFHADGFVGVGEGLEERGEQVGVGDAGAIDERVGAGGAEAPAVSTGGPQLASIW